MSKKLTPKSKGIAIIESCTICEHFTNAMLYLDLYLKSTKDKEGYDELVALCNSKKMELKCYDYA